MLFISLMPFLPMFSDLLESLKRDLYLFKLLNDDQKKHNPDTFLHTIKLGFFHRNIHLLKLTTK